MQVRRKLRLKSILKLRFRVEPVHVCGAEVRGSSVLKHVVLVHFINLSRHPLQLSRNSLVSSCEDSSRTEGPIVVLGMVSRALRKRLEGTTLSHQFLKSSTKRWRRIRRICPQLLDHDFCHSDLFLLSLSMSLRGRHPCSQSRGPVDELPVLLLCQTHSCHGRNHNTSSRQVQGSGCSATKMR